ncbi:MAG: hypothetical protein K8R36_25630 [Planctomycetales bacterium]|nr:hypothetical protein [Planctomycetales bacterium]
MPVLVQNQLTNRHKAGGVGNVSHSFPLCRQPCSRGSGDQNRAHSEAVGRQRHFPKCRGSGERITALGKSPMMTAAMEYSTRAHGSASFPSPLPGLFWCFGQLPTASPWAWFYRRYRG